MPSIPAVSPWRAMAVMVVGHATPTVPAPGTGPQSSRGKAHPDRARVRSGCWDTIPSMQEPGRVVERAAADTGFLPAPGSTST